jgi:hypothetical protein
MDWVGLPYPRSRMARAAATACGPRPRAMATRRLSANGEASRASATTSALVRGRPPGLPDFPFLNGRPRAGIERFYPQDCPCRSVLENDPSLCSASRGMSTNQNMYLEPEPLPLRGRLRRILRRWLGRRTAHIDRVWNEAWESDSTQGHIDGLLEKAVRTFMNRMFVARTTFLVAMWFLSPRLEYLHNEPHVSEWLLIAIGLQIAFFIGSAFLISVSESRRWIYETMSISGNSGFFRAADAFPRSPVSLDRPGVDAEDKY